MNHALQNEETELWHVEVAPNDVRVVTLEQLDEAFQQGLVNERTRVFQDGMDEPAYLGDLLGLGEESEEEAEAQSSVHPTAAQASSRIHQDTLVGLAAEPSRSPAPQQRPPAPAPARAPWGPAASAPPQSYRPQQSAPPPAARTRRPPPPAEGAWPPVVTRAPAPAAPAAAVSLAPTAPAVVAPSVVPMALDLGDDLDFPRPKRKGKVVLLAFGAIAAAAGVVLAVTGQGRLLLNSFTAGQAPAAAAAAIVAKPAPVVHESHAYDPGNAPIKLHDAPPPVVITTRENEAQQLAAAGMTKEAADEAGSLTKSSKEGKSAPSRAISSRHAHHAAPSRHHGKAKGSGGHAFKSGGGKSSVYDPLNGQL